MSKFILNLFTVIGLAVVIGIIFASVEAVGGIEIHSVIQNGFTGGVSALLIYHLQRKEKKKGK